MPALFRRVERPAIHDEQLRLRQALDLLHDISFDGALFEFVIRVEFFDDIRSGVEKTVRWRIFTNRGHARLHPFEDCCGRWQFTATRAKKRRHQNTKTNQSADHSARLYHERIRRERPTKPCAE